MTTNAKAHTQEFKVGVVRYVLDHPQESIVSIACLEVLQVYLPLKHQKWDETLVPSHLQRAISFVNQS